MKCEMCPTTISEIRLALQPQTVTCSAECAAARKKLKKRRQAAAAHKRSGYKAQKAYRARQAAGAVLE